jgi:glutathione S-transferase
MITLYTFGPFFGLPDPSPFVMKAEMLLKIAGLKYETSTRGFDKAPKGKLPYIVEGETLVADSTLIRLYLEQQHGIDFDRGLDARERGVGWAAEKMLEDHLYWILIYWRWLTEPNFSRGPRNFFKRAPAIIRPLVERFVLRRIRRNLHGHGIGRHSETETTMMANRGIEALAQILGDNRYFLGATPAGADATVFAFVAGTLTSHFDSPVRSKMQSMENLVAYRDRMMREYFPQFAQELDK